MEVDEPSPEPNLKKKRKRDSSIGSKLPNQDNTNSKSDEVVKNTPSKAETRRILKKRRQSKDPSNKSEVKSASSKSMKGGLTPAKDVPMDLSPLPTKPDRPAVPKDISMVKKKRSYEAHLRRRKRVKDNKKLKKKLTAASSKDTSH